MIKRRSLIILFQMPSLLIRWLGEVLIKKGAVICMEQIFQNEFRKALQSNANEEEKILIRQSYQMGYAAAERRIENATRNSFRCLGDSEKL